MQKDMETTRVMRGMMPGATGLVSGSTTHGRFDKGLTWRGPAF